MTARTMPSSHEFPPRADLRDLLTRNPLPKPSYGMVDPASMSRDEPAKEAQLILNSLNAAIAQNNARALADCFLDQQAYWRDQLALTYHLRTFKTPNIIAFSLLQTSKLRGVKGDIEIDGGAIFQPVTPALVSE